MSESWEMWMTNASNVQVSVFLPYLVGYGLYHPGS